MKKKRTIKLFAKALSGVVLGLANGFFGGGAGMLCVPILNRLFGLEKKKAHASSIGVILPLSLISGIIYLTKNSISTKSILFVGLGLVIGAAVGGKFLKKISSKTLRIVFAFLMFFAGLSMVIL